MKRKKGFTLIELLAVIVILAIIALIATPIILNMINDAKKSAAKDSAYGYIEAIEYNNGMADIGLNNGYTKIEGTDLDVTTLDVKVKGSKPTSGEITIEKGIVTKANLCINNYNVSYDGQVATITGNCGGNGSSSGGSSDNGSTKYIEYEDGKEVYYNPTTGEICNDYVDTNSKTGTKTGCMKFYIFNDSESSSTVDMILDHNTTAIVQWNSSGKKADGMKEAKSALEADTTGWKVSKQYDGLNARLITADEVAHIVGADNSKTIKWNSSKEYGTDDIDKKISWYYLDGTGSTYSGWQQQTANSTNNSKYYWLYINTYNCLSYGCKVQDNGIYQNFTKDNMYYTTGYWTSTPTPNSSREEVWRVLNYGYVMDYLSVNSSSDTGIRPVITIEKSLIS